jgi:hypothetical protein
MKYKNLILLILFAVLVFGGAIFFQRFQAGAEWLWTVSNQGQTLLPLVVVSSLVDSINPCAFSILIVSIVFLFGLGKTRENIFKFGIAYILGIFLVYLLIGLGIMQVLHIFSVPHFMSKVGAALLIIFGVINILETLFPKFPIRFAIPHSAHHKMNDLVQKVSLPGAQSRHAESRGPLGLGEVHGEGLAVGHFHDLGQGLAEQARVILGERRGEADLFHARFFLVGGVADISMLMNQAASMVADPAAGPPAVGRAGRVGNHAGRLVHEH